MKFHITNCATCIQTKPLSKEESRTPLESVSLDIEQPGEIMMIDLVGPFPTSGGYSQILTAMDVFSRYFFTVPLVRVDAPSIVKALLHIFTTHAYIPNKIISDKGSVFVSHIFQELTQQLKIQTSHATVKHPQTIGSLERSHSTIKRLLGIHTNKRFTNWHRFLSLTTYEYNTTYHTTIGSTPTQIFHGREPIRPLDVRFNGKLAREHAKSFDDQTNLDQHMALYDKARENSILNFKSYRSYYDRKAKANPLSQDDFCFLLHPKLSKQNDALAIDECRWISLFEIVQVLTHSNYLIRRVNTTLTQVVHRIRLRKYVPPSLPVDICITQETQFEPDNTHPWSPWNIIFLITI